VTKDVVSASQLLQLHPRNDFYFGQVRPPYDDDDDDDDDDDGDDDDNADEYDNGSNQLNFSVVAAGLEIPPEASMRQQPMNRPTEFTQRLCSPV